MTGWLLAFNVGCPSCGAAPGYKCVGVYVDTFKVYPLAIDKPHYSRVMASQKSEPVKEIK